MSSIVQVLTTPGAAPGRATARPGGSHAALGYLQAKSVAALSASVPLLLLLLFVVIGHFTVDLIQYRPLSARPLQPPSRELPFGS